MFECSLLKASIKWYKRLYGFFLNVTILLHLKLNLNERDWNTKAFKFSLLIGK